jgi:LysM repeat protein
MSKMNPFTPILPPGSPLARVPAAQRRSRVRLTVSIVLAINTFALVGMLIQGCIHANPTTTVAHTAATDALVSGVTTNAPPAARLRVMVSDSQLHAPLAAAPATTPRSAPLLTMRGAALKNYFVVKGDTYSKIAKTSGVLVSALAKANPGIDPARLRIGQVLHIPVVGQNQMLSLNVKQASVEARQ